MTAIGLNAERRVESQRRTISRSVSVEGDYGKYIWNRYFDSS